MKSNFFILIYRILELLDGEKIRYIKLIPYSIAEKIKVFC